MSPLPVFSPLPLQHIFVGIPNECCPDIFQRHGTVDGSNFLPFFRAKTGALHHRSPHIGLKKGPTAGFGIV